MTCMINYVLLGIHPFKIQRVGSLSIGSEKVGCRRELLKGHQTENKNIEEYPRDLIRNSNGS